MILRSLTRMDDGASAVEFALVLPLLLLLLFGIIDTGRYLWGINRAEKAAQMGVRTAVVTQYISSSLDTDYVGQCATPLQAGDTIPASCFTQITCTRPAASATCTSGTANTAAFDRVLSRMQAFMPEIRANNVQIIYSPSGLGYAGDPSGPDVAPLVTVRLTGLTFRPAMLLALASIGLPEVRTSLTLEDAAGTQSN
jgi:Flp pilus assembly protein TadG